MPLCSCTVSLRVSVQRSPEAKTCRFNSTTCHRPLKALVPKRGSFACSPATRHTTPVSCPRCTARIQPQCTTDPREGLHHCCTHRSIAARAMSPHQRVRVLCDVVTGTGCTTCARLPVPRDRLRGGLLGDGDGPRAAGICDRPSEGSCLAAEGESAGRVCRRCREGTGGGSCMHNSYLTGASYARIRADMPTCGDAPRRMLEGRGIVRGNRRQ